MKNPIITSYGRKTSPAAQMKAMCVEFPSGLALWFSYSTVIAFRDELGANVTMRENDWNNTTAQHMYAVPRHPNKNERLPSQLFEKRLNEMLKFHGLA